jgi:hypothetical protein
MCRSNVTFRISWSPGSATRVKRELSMPTNRSNPGQRSGPQVGNRNRLRGGQRRVRARSIRGTPMAGMAPPHHASLAGPCRPRHPAGARRKNT